MRLREEQIRRLADKICSDLVGENLVTLRRGRAELVAGIFKVIQNDVRREQALEKDAERMLDETIAAMGRGATEIDRRKMLRLVKEKLAKDRKIIL